MMIRGQVGLASVILAVWIMAFGFRGAASSSSDAQPLRIGYLGDKALPIPLELPPTSRIVGVYLGRYTSDRPTAHTSRLVYIVLTDFDRRSAERFFRQYIERKYRGYFVAWRPMLNPGTKAESRHVWVFRDRSLRDEVLYISTDATLSRSEVRKLGLPPEDANRTAIQIAVRADRLFTEEFLNKDFVIPIPR